MKVKIWKNLDYSVAEEVQVNHLTNEQVQEVLALIRAALGARMTIKSPLQRMFDFRIEE